MIIDVSGYSYSGKGAVVDILRDFSSLDVHQKEFEFLLIRATDGLLDLRNHLVNNPSEIRIDMAIRRFIKLTRNLSAKPTSIFQPISLFTLQANYSNLFPGFDSYTMDFISNISFQNHEYWPFPLLYQSNFDSFLEKLNKLLINVKAKKYISNISKEDFDVHLNSYLRNVLLVKSVRIRQRLLQAICLKSTIQFISLKQFNHANL